MDHPPPSAKSLKQAWEAGQRTRSAYTLDAEVLVLALLHGASIGAASAPTTLQESTNSAHLQTARLFVALQVKLARDPRCLEKVTPGWFDQLLAGMPKPWVHALQARLLRPEQEPPASEATVPVARRGRPQFPVALADMQAMGRA